MDITDTVVTTATDTDTKVSQPSSSVCVDNDLIASLHIEDDVLTGHTVLMVVLVVLVEDGSNLLSILPDGQERLLVVMGGDVELEHVGSSTGAGEDSSVDIKTTPNVAGGTLECEVLLATAIIGFGSVGVEVDSKGFAVERLQECVLLKHLGLEVIDIADSLIVL